MLLNEKINFLLSQIKTTESVEASQHLFLELHTIQGHIIKLAMQESLPISDNLWEFTSDFDRIDDKLTQEFVFNKIKNGAYIPT
jgi:hypothetical protein